MLEKLIRMATKEQLVALSDKITERIREIDIIENKDSNIILEIGKTYTARNGNKIQIIDKYMSVYKGINLTDNNTKDIKIKFPEYYIDGRTSKQKQTQLDIIKE